MPHITGSMEQPLGTFVQCAWGCARPGPGEHVCTCVGVQGHWFLCSVYQVCTYSEGHGDWGASLSPSPITPFLWVHPCCFPLLAAPPARGTQGPRSSADSRWPFKSGPFKARALSPPPSLLRSGSAQHFRCCLCPFPKWRRRSGADAAGHFRPGNGHGAARLGRLWGRRGSLPAT